MMKMPCVFERDRKTGKMTRELNLSCAWLLDPNENVVARRLHDGVTFLYQRTLWWYLTKLNPDKAPPFLLEPAETDPSTGIIWGWARLAEASRDDPDYQAIAELNQAFDDANYLLAFGDAQVQEGYYELVGPMVNGNPENWAGHTLVPYSGMRLAPLDFEDFTDYDVLHHDLWFMHNSLQSPYGSPWSGYWFEGKDGKMAKVEWNDFPDAVPVKPSVAMHAQTAPVEVAEATEPVKAGGLTKCPRCDGCGAVSSEDGQKPFSSYAFTDAKVVFKKVWPVMCPRCGGTKEVTA